MTLATLGALTGSGGGGGGVSHACRFYQISMSHVSVDYFWSCHMSILRNNNVTSFLLLLHSLSRMLSVDFKNEPCRHVEFRVEGRNLNVPVAGKQIVNTVL